MKRHPTLASFSRDHHHALITAQYIKKGAPKYRGLSETLEGKCEYALRFFTEHLVEHFEKEEKILFRKTKNITPSIDLLIEELVAEHRTIELLIQQLQTHSNTEAILNGLGMLLESHIRKEERILFPQLQETLSPGDFKELQQLLDRGADAGEEV